MDKKRALELIPTDLLAYNTTSNSYSALSNKEIELIVVRCYETMRGIIPENELFNYAKSVVDEWNIVKISNLLYERFLDGDIMVVFNDDGEMTFLPVLEDDEQREDWEKN